MVSIGSVVQSPFSFVEGSSDTAFSHLLLDVFQLLLQFFSLQFQFQIVVVGEKFLLLLGLSGLVCLVDGLFGDREENVSESLFKSVKQCPSLKF